MTVPYENLFLRAKSSMQTIFTEDLSTSDGIFLSKSQMLLLQMVIFSLFNNFDAVSELNRVDV